MYTTPKASDYALSQIGFRQPAPIAKDIDSHRIDLEETLLAVVSEFPENHHLISVLLTWIEVHGNYVIVEKLAKLVAWSDNGVSAIPTWIVLVAAWAVQCGYHKWCMLLKPVNSPSYLFTPETSEEAIKDKGLIDWLEPLGFRLPNDSLQISENSVLTPEELIALNLQYRNRYLYGASWRADIITVIQQGLSSPTAISNELGCSYEPAHRISREYAMASRASASKENEKTLDCKGLVDGKCPREG
jgi:hypothetical protein